MSASRARQICGASEVAQSVKNLTLVTESHAAALSKVEPERRQEVALPTISGVSAVYPSTLPPTVEGMKPSPSVLDAFAAILRQLEPAELVTLRKRFIELGEDAEQVAMIEREIELRANDVDC